MCVCVGGGGGIEMEGTYDQDPVCDRASVECRWKSNCKLPQKRDVNHCTHMHICKRTQPLIYERVISMCIHTLYSMPSD